MVSVANPQPTLSTSWQPIHSALCGLEVYAFQSDTLTGRLQQCYLTLAIESMSNVHIYKNSLQENKGILTHYASGVNLGLT